MDDLWGNAWSVTGSEDDTAGPQGSLHGPKWSTFERDADEDTVDVGVPSWNTISGVGWGDETPETPLPLPAPFSEPPFTDEPTPPSPSRSLTAPGSPDPFGSFESAEVPEVEKQPATWIPTVTSPSFSPEATAEAWGDPWGGNDMEDTPDEGNDRVLNDEWELAKQARRKRESQVPPELLGSLVAQWDELAKDIYSECPPDDGESSNWRKGLDNVEGLAELVDSALPSTSFLPPVQFPTTAVAKAVKESLRLTRSYGLTRSSPMAHLYASKGSNDWERSVKAQKIAARDEWGWDLKHESEEKLVPETKDKKGNGLLSFWGRKANSNSSPSPTDAPASIQPKSPTTLVKSASPAPSVHPGIDVSATAASSRVASPAMITTPVSPAATAEPESSIGDGSAMQPSVVSRFFNRFSRKPSAAAVTTEKDNRRSLALSANDLSFLSDVTPSNSEGSLVHHGTDSIGSLEAMLSSPPQPQRYSSASSSKLPPPLAPPPSSLARFSGPSSPVSQMSDASFDAKMTETQFMDLLLDMKSSPAGGYAPVSFDLIDAPSESKPLPSALQSLGPSSPRHPPPFPPQLPAASSISNTRPSSRLGTFTVPPAFSLPLSPTKAPPSLSSPIAHVQDSGALPSVSPSPLPFPHLPVDESTNLSSMQPIHNPLPPPPKRDPDHVNDFFSASTSSAQPQRQPRPSPSSPTLSSDTPNLFLPSPNRTGYAPSTSTGTPADLSDFGNFISTPVQPPTLPKVPRKKSRAANHKPTIELVENAASRPGRWPAPPSPLPQPLAPPPSLSSGISYFNMSSGKQVQQDLISNDSPEKSPSALGVFSASGQTATFPPPPMFAAPPLRPASTIFPGLPMPPPGTSSSQPPTPSLTPLTSAPPKASTKSGLSAQDLTFFEGL